MSELKTFKPRVEKILEKYENTRNSDLSLLAQYLFIYQKSILSYTEDGEPCVRLKDFKKMPPSQTLVNNRKIIQNHDGLFLPTDPKVKRARQIKEKNIRDAEYREAKETKPLNHIDD